LLAPFSQNDVVKDPL